MCQCHVYQPNHSSQSVSALMGVLYHLPAVTDSDWEEALEIERQFSEKQIPEQEAIQALASLMAY